MNPLRVDSAHAALMAFAVGVGVAIIVTVVMHYGSGALTQLSAAIMNTGAATTTASS